MDIIDYKALGQRVRRLRQEHKLTQEELAEQIGVSHSFVGHIERGSRKASLETLVMLANVMEISTDDLLQGSLSASEELVKPVKKLTQNQWYVMRQVISTLEQHMERWDEK